MACPEKTTTSHRSDCGVNFIVCFLTCTMPSNFLRRRFANSRFLPFLQLLLPCISDRVLFVGKNILASTLDSSALQECNLLGQSARFYGVTVSTEDFKSFSRGSIPRGTSFLLGLPKCTPLCPLFKATLICN